MFRLEHGASGKAEHHAEDDGQHARQEEGVVEHELTNAGCTGVVHLNSTQQRRVGRENEQSGHSSERSDQHVGVARVSSRNTQSRNHSRSNGLSGSSLAIQQHSGKEEDHSQQSRVLRHGRGREFRDFFRVTSNERVTEPCNAQHANASHHTALEHRATGDFVNLDLAHNSDQGTDRQHDAHNGSITTNDNRADDTDSRRNSGGVQHHSNNANQEDPHGLLSRSADFAVRSTLRSLHETLSQTIFVDRVRVQVHVLDQGHNESRDHAASERRHNPDTEQGRIAPTERFQNTRHVNHGCGNRRSRNSNLGRDHSDRQRANRLNALFLSHFNDNRDHGESRVTRTGEDRQHIGNNRSQIVDVLRIATKDVFSDLNQVVETAGQLHSRNSSDHGHDDQDHIPGNRTRRHAANETQDQHTDTAGVADTNAAQANTNKDERQEDNNLKN